MTLYDAIMATVTSTACLVMVVAVVNVGFEGLTVRLAALVDRAWRLMRAGMHRLAYGPPKRAVEAPAYDDQPPRKCKCHVRGGRGDIVPVEVYDTPTGEPEVARYVCTTCWLEIHDDHVPNRVRVTNARRTADAFALTPRPVEPLSVETLVGRWDGTHRRERLTVLDAALAKRRDEVVKMQRAWAVNDVLGTYEVTVEDAARYKALAMECKTLEREIERLSTITVSDGGPVLVCGDPVYPTEDIMAADGTTLWSLVSGPCERCGRTQFEHGEITPIRDPDTGEHLGDVQRGADGMAHAATEQTALYQRNLRALRDEFHRASDLIRDPVERARMREEARRLWP